MISKLFDSSTEVEYCDRSRRTTPITADEHILKVHDAPNGHLHRTHTLFKNVCSIPTSEYDECAICDLSGHNINHFYENCRRQTCLEHAIEVFTYRNKYKGKKLIEQVCEDKGIIEAHQFAEGIHIPK